MTSTSNENIPICFSYLASVAPYTVGGRRFVKVFIIDSAVNANKWQVTDAARRRAAEALIGLPLIGPPELAHEGRRVVGRFVSEESNGATYGIAEITDPAAWASIRNGTWRYVSPQVHGNVTRRVGDVEVLEDFTWDHVAFVKEPAYGDKARVYGVCEGVDTPALCTFAASLTHTLNAKNAQKYPWDECIQDRLRDGYTEEQARRICAAIKNRTINRGSELGLWRTEQDGVAYIAKKTSEDPLYAYTLDLLARVPAEFFEAEFSHSLKSEPDRGMTNLAAGAEKSAEVREPTSKQKGANMTDPCLGISTQLEAELRLLKTENETLKAQVAAIEETKHLAAVKDTVDLRVKAGLIEEKDRGAEIERLKMLNADALAAMRTDLNAVIKRAEAFVRPKAKYAAEHANTLEDEVRRRMLGTAKHLWEKEEG